MVSGSNARLQEYIDKSREEQKIIAKEIRDAKDKEIERLADLNGVKGALVKAQAQKISMLLKEKEWLLNHCVLHVWSLGDSKRHYKQEIIQRMQQALKEE